MTEHGSGLFQPSTPLADALRPQTLEEMLGQQHLMAGTLDSILAQAHMPSLILWGPPGCGKTTLARLIGAHANAAFCSLPSSTNSVQELKAIFQRAQETHSTGGQTIVFVDEIHRFNRSQQNSFLPWVEDGTVILVGATTENPSFELIPALLSRCRVLTLEPLDEDAMRGLVRRAEAKTGTSLNISKAARAQLYALAAGDGRHLLNMTETLLAHSEPVSDEAFQHLVQARAHLYDKAGEAHYNLISTLHKAMRGSDCDAALYWLARMLAGGEDPRYIARRLLRFAYEDIGMADPEAAVQALTAWQTYERLGSPEGELALVHAVVYLATAPKSNAINTAYKAASTAAKASPAAAPPRHALNAPTALMKNLGYGEGYRYDHDQEGAFAGQDYFPEGMARTAFYTPSERGLEPKIAKRLAFWRAAREQSN